MRHYNRYARRTMRRFRRGDPMIIVNTEPPVIWVIISWLFRITWKYRSELAPFTVGVLVYAAAIWASLTFPTWWPAVAVAGGLLIVLVWLAPESWAKHWPPLGRRIERAYVSLVVGYVTGWASAAMMLGPLAPGLPLIALAGVIICGIPWWTHRRRREKVRIKRVVEAWPDIAEHCRIPGVEIKSVDIDEWGWTAHIRLNRGATVTALVAATESLDGAFRVAPGSVRILADPKRADRAHMRVMERNPHAETIPYPQRSGPATIADPVPLGYFENGEPVEVPIFASHTLVGGATGGGKSGVVNALLTGIVRCPDVRIVGVDMKGGMELRPWRSCIDTIAFTQEQAIDLTAWVRQEVERRAEQLAVEGLRSWPVSKKRPALLLLVDEFAELPPEAKANIDSISRLGRATGVSLLLATQRPSQKTLGGEAIVGQMTTKISMRLNLKKEIRFILGDGMAAAGWRPDRLTVDGTFLIHNRAYQQPMRARAFWISDTDVAATAATYGRPDDESLAPVTGFAAAPPAPRPDDTHPTNQKGRSEARSDANDAGTMSTGGRPARPPQVPAQGWEADVWRALAHAPPEGVRTADLATLSGKTRQWVRKFLRELETAGWVENTAYGHWRAIGPDSDHEPGTENT